MTERNPSSLTASMTEQQADCLMEWLEGARPYYANFTEVEAALTALCWHRDFAVYEAVLEECRDWQTIDALDNMQTWGEL